MFAGFGGLVLQSVAGYWPFPRTLPETFTASAWTERLPAAAGTLSATLVVAAGATVLSLPLAVLLLEAHRRGVRVKALVYLPLVVPQVAFLFGLSVLAIASGLIPGMVAVTLAHTLFTLPYVLIALSGPWAALDPRYERVAASLGAGPWRRFAMVRLPMMAGPLCVAAALSLAVSVGLYLPTQMIGGGRVETVTTEAVAAAAGGDRRLIGLLACLQLLLPLLAFSMARAVPSVLFRHRRGMRPARAAA
jgi:putative thiamine transport system permease protein